MKTYHVLETLPGGPEDVAVLLDADITKDRFRRTNSDLWHAAIKTRALSRIPGYGESYREFVSSNYSKDNEAIISAKVIARGSHLGGTISWINDAKLGKGQLTHAVEGTFMTFEKAVVCILALNSLIVEDIKRFEADLVRDTQQLAAIEAGGAESGGPVTGQAPDAAQLKARIEVATQSIERLKGALIGEHSIIISCFYFFDIAPVVRAAVSSGAYPSLPALANAISSSEANQPANVILALFGDVTNTDTSWDKIDRTVKNVASYPTMRAIFKTLLAIEACRNIVGTANREAYIQRLHVGIGNKRAIPEERMIHPQKITRPPYDWSAAAHGEEPYPPGFHDD